MSERACAKRKASRCLFGRPDKEKLDKMLRTELEGFNKANREKYGFDFSKDVPLKGGEYDFEPVPMADIPQVYHPRVVRPKKKREVVEEVEEEVEERVEINVEEPSTSKRVTRSSARLIKEKSLEEDKTLKQAKLTNYMMVRKRRSESNLLDRRLTKDSSEPIKGDSEPRDLGFTPRKSHRLKHSHESEAPRSPFRFATAEPDFGADRETSLSPIKKVKRGVSLRKHAE
ncbi:unnamed protein product [Caenorhabditis auriculariae]|uniref:Cyclin-dependent kinase inhibitor domain-containing protein n=1 Tax=Caenorhabditis auriculariae TaxID=2777116 RepID=A0A8S1H9F7_9PELO|nr:unnamed protein product [Caenorhabditis auriculariae]